MCCKPFCIHYDCAGGRVLVKLCQKERCIRTNGAIKNEHDYSLIMRVSAEFIPEIISLTFLISPIRARSCAPIPGYAPIRITSSLMLAVISVTSIMVIFIATRPMIGAYEPLINTELLLESWNL